VYIKAEIPLMLPHPPLPHAPRSQIYTGVSVATFSLYSDQKKLLSKTTFSPILTHLFGYVPLGIDLFPVINQMEVDLASQGDPDLPEPPLKKYWTRKKRRRRERRAVKKILLIFGYPLTISVDTLSILDYLLSFSSSDLSLSLFSKPHTHTIDS
jgi:hypothetical protein